MSGVSGSSDSVGITESVVASTANRMVDLDKMYNNHLHVGQGLRIVFPLLADAAMTVSANMYAEVGPFEKIPTKEQLQKLDSYHIHKPSNSSRGRSTKQDLWHAKETGPLEIAKYFVASPLGPSGRTAKSFHDLDVNFCANFLRFVKYLGLQTRVFVDVRNEWAHNGRQQIVDVDKAQLLRQLQKGVQALEKRRLISPQHSTETQGRLEKLVTAGPMSSTQQMEIFAFRVKEVKMAVESMHSALCGLAQLRGSVDDIAAQHELVLRHLESLHSLQEVVAQLPESIGLLRADVGHCIAKVDELPERIQRLHNDVHMCVEKANQFDDLKTAVQEALREQAKKLDQIADRFEERLQAHTEQIIDEVKKIPERTAELVGEYLSHGSQDEIMALFAVPQCVAPFRLQKDLDGVKQLILGEERTVVVYGNVKLLDNTGPRELAAALARDPDVVAQFNDRIRWYTMTKLPTMTASVVFTRLAISFGAPDKGWRDESLKEPRIAFNWLCEHVGNAPVLFIADQTDTDQAQFLQYFEDLPTCRLLLLTTDDNTSLVDSHASYAMVVADETAALEAAPLLRELASPVAARDLVRLMATDALELRLACAFLEGASARDCEVFVERACEHKATLLAWLVGEYLSQLDTVLQQCWYDLAAFRVEKDADVTVPLSLLQSMWTDCEAASEAMQESLVSLLQLDGDRVDLDSQLLGVLCDRCGDVVPRHIKVLDAYTARLSPSVVLGYCNWWAIPEDDGYFFSYVCYHLFYAKRYRELLGLLTNFAWLQRCFEVGGANLLKSVVLVPWQYVGISFDELFALHSVQHAVDKMEMDSMSVAQSIVACICQVPLPRMKQLVADSMDHLTERGLPFCAPLCDLWLSSSPAGAITFPLLPLSSQLKAVEMLDDGSRCLVFTPHHISVFDVASGLVLKSSKIARPDKESKWGFSVAVSADGCRAAVVVGGTSVIVWNVESCETVEHCLEDNLRFPKWLDNAIAMSPDGEHIVVVHHHNKCLLRFPLFSTDGLLQSEAVVEKITVMKMLPDGRSVVFGCDSRVGMWVMDENALRWSEPMAPTTCCGDTMLALSRDGTHGVGGIRGSDNVYVWSLDGNAVATVACIETGLAHTKNIVAVALTDDCSRIVTMDGAQQILCVWDVASRQLIQSIANDYKSNRTPAFISCDGLFVTSDGRYAVSVCIETASIRRWCLSWPQQAVCSSDDNILACCERFVVMVSQSKGVCLLDFDTLEQRPLAIGVIARWAAVTPDGRFVATLGNDGGLRVWNAERGEQIAHAESEGGGAVVCARLSSDGTRIVSGSKSGAVIVWATDSLERVAFCQHTKAAYHVATISDGKRFVSAHQASLCVWSAAETEPVFETDIDSGVVCELAVTSDDTRMILILSGRHFLVVVRNLATGDIVARYNCGEMCPSRLLPSPDSECVMMEYNNGTLLWNFGIGDGRKLFLKGLPVLWTRDGCHAVTADRAVRVCDGMTGQMVYCVCETMSDNNYFIPEFISAFEDRFVFKFSVLLKNFFRGCIIRQ